MCQRQSPPRPRKATMSSAGGVAGGRAAGAASRPRRRHHLSAAWAARAGWQAGEERRPRSKAEGHAVDKIILSYLSLIDTRRPTPENPASNRAQPEGPPPEAPRAPTASLPHLSCAVTSMHPSICLSVWGGTLACVSMGYSQSKATLDLCVNVRACRRSVGRAPLRPTHAYFAAPVSQGPQGRVVPFGGARQGPIVGYVLQLAAPTGPSP